MPIATAEHFRVIRDVIDKKRQRTLIILTCVVGNCRILLCWLHHNVRYTFCIGSNRSVKVIENRKSISRRGESRINIRWRGSTKVGFTKIPTWSSLQQKNRFCIKSKQQRNFNLNYVEVWTGLMIGWCLTVSQHKYVKLWWCAIHWLMASVRM